MDQILKLIQSFIFFQWVLCNYEQPKHKQQHSYLVIILLDGVLMHLILFKPQFSQKSIYFFLIFLQPAHRSAPFSLKASWQGNIECLNLFHFSARQAVEEEVLSLGSYNQAAKGASKLQS